MTDQRIPPEALLDNGNVERMNGISSPVDIQERWRSSHRLSARGYVRIQEKHGGDGIPRAAGTGPKRTFPAI